MVSSRFSNDVVIEKGKHMVNLYLKSENVEDPTNLAYKICEYLKGNRGFEEDDIIVTNPDKNGVLCISLGDDNTAAFDISAEVVGTVAHESNVEFYMSEENSSGILTMSKNDLLNRLSDRIDELVSEGIDTVEVLLIT